MSEEETVLIRRWESTEGMAGLISVKWPEGRLHQIAAEPRENVLEAAGRHSSSLSCLFY